MAEGHGGTPSENEITPELVAGAVTEAEEGYDLDEVTLKAGPGRRPEIERKAAPVQSVRLGADLTKAAAERAKSAGITKAELTRGVVREYLSRSP